MALQVTSMKMFFILTSILANLVIVHSYNCYTYNGESFLFVSAKKTYDQAESNCKQYPAGKLWDPSNPWFWTHENNYVYNKANQLFTDEEYWIGNDWANNNFGGSWRSELERAKPTAKECWDYSQKNNMQGRAMRVCGMSFFRDTCKCFTQAANNYNTPVNCASIPGSKTFNAPRASVCHLFMGCDFHLGWGRTETKN